MWQRQKIQKVLRSLATALLFWLSFPKPDLGFCAFITLVPLLSTIFQYPVVQPFMGVFNTGMKPHHLHGHKALHYHTTFLWGVLHGFLAYGAIFYWIIPTITAAGQTLGLGILALTVLAAYLAAYIGAFAVLVNWLNAGPILGAAIWVTLEYARTYFLTGFPWALLGYTQWKYLPVIQISEFTGVYGVSFLVVLVNFGLYTLIQHVIASVAKQSHSHYQGRGLLRYVRNDMLKKFLIPLIFISFTLFFGVHKLYYPSPPPSPPRGEGNQGNFSHPKREISGEMLKIAILQGNIDQYKKWDEAYTDEIMAAYTALAKQAARFSPDLVVWPETAVPGWLPQEHKYLEWVRQTVKLAGGWHLVGTPSTNRGKDYNSAFLFNSAGVIATEYHKTHLVPFGETVPLRPLLSPWIRVLNELGDFDSGSSYKPLYSEVADIGITICFEAIFPDLVRKFVNNGADVLVNITNDAWYLDTAGPYQHFIMNVFRAVENRRPLIRAANTGISGAIDQYGRIITKSPLLKQGVVQAKISLDASRKTFYTKHGDIFAWACVVVMFFGVITKFRRMVV